MFSEGCRYTLIGLADGYGMLLLGRLLTGIGVGVVSLTTPVYIAEVAPTRCRVPALERLRFSLRDGTCIILDIQQKGPLWVAFGIVVQFWRDSN